MRGPRRLLDDGVQRLHEVQEQPSVVLTWIKKSLVSTWLLRGGGFYGLGYLITFFVLQARSLALDFQEAEDALGFISSQLFQLLFKFFTDVLANLIQAFIWPLMVINYLEGWGILVLIAGFIGFDRWCKPYINQRIPELHAADQKRQAKLAKKREAKASKQAKKDAKNAVKAEKREAKNERKQRKKESRKAKE